MNNGTKNEETNIERIMRRNSYSRTENYFMNNKITEKTIQKNTLKLIRAIINTILGKKNKKIDVFTIDNNCLIGGEKVFRRKEDYQKLNINDIICRFGKYNKDNLIFYNNSKEFIIVDMYSVLNYMQNLGIIMRKFETPHIKRNGQSIFKEPYDERIISYAIDINQAKTVLKTIKTAEFRKGL